MEIVSDRKLLIHHLHFILLQINYSQNLGVMEYLESFSIRQVLQSILQDMYM